MDYVQRLQMANLQLELDRNAAQVNIVVAQAGCLSVCSSHVRSVCPSFAGGSRPACPRVDSSSDTTRFGTGLSLAGGLGDFLIFAEVFLFGMTGFVKGRRDNDTCIWCHNLANCNMPTTKSCTFVGGLDTTVALPAWIVLAPYRIVEASWAFVSIRSSTVVNRSVAVLSRSGSVDESCRHRRSIVRHRIDAGISFFPSWRIPMQPDFTICLKSGWVVVNRGLNRDSVTGALHQKWRLTYTYLLHWWLRQGKIWPWMLWPACWATKPAGLHVL